MNFVFIMIHIREFYVVLKVSRHQLTTSFDIPCLRPNYEGDFLCSCELSQIPSNVAIPESCSGLTACKQAVDTC